MRFTQIFTAGVVAMGFMAGSANAVVLTSFGEDLSSSSSVPLASTPNATAAAATFLSGLTGVGTENFEGIGSGTSAPLALTFPGFGNGNAGW